MATLISYATNNLTAASATWKASETASGALTMVRANTTTLATNTTITSPAFTITNAKVIEGVMLWVMANAAAPAGTLTVNILKSGVSQTSVTVNCADLPHSATGTNDVLAVVPVFFKFTGTATGDGTANWTINMVTSNNASATITYSRNSATTGDFTKALRTSTTATAAAGDDLYVLGELTGAGTHNSFTVTMDSTATTQYGNGSVNSTSVNGGGVRVSAYGTFAYGTSASTSYYFKCKGDIEVFWNGTYSAGSSGSEIPRTSSAITEMVMNAASGDFGVNVRNLGTFNAAGLSRTSGKNVTKCLLNTDATAQNVLPATSSPTGYTNGSASLATGSLVNYGFFDNSTNGQHAPYWQDPTLRTSVTQTGAIWLSAGSGTHNRFVRFSIGDGGGTNQVYIDVDLSLGTILAHGTTGNGVYTSSSVTARTSDGTAGYLFILTGKASTSAGDTIYCVPYACSAQGTISYAGDSTQCYLFSFVTLVVGSSLNSSLGVDTDTGWLNTDSIGVASTSQTRGECEITSLTADASSSSLTAITQTSHSGTSPTQGEVALLTRNNIIRSNSTTLWGYIHFEPLATVTMTWTEMRYLGSNATNKFGVVADDGAAANAQSLSYCSIHDSYYGIVLPFTNHAVINFNCDHTVFWNQTVDGVHVSSYGSGTTNGYTFDNNIVGFAGGYGFSDWALAGVVTNNAAVGCTSGGFAVTTNSATANQPINNFSGNFAHANASNGMIWTGSGNLAAIPSGSIATLKSWRNNGAAFNVSSIDTNQITIDSPTFFGNATRNIYFNTNQLVINGGTIAADTTFATASGLDCQHSSISGYTQSFILNGVDMSGSGTGLAAHATIDIKLDDSATFSSVGGICNGCNFGTANVFSQNKANWATNAFLHFEKFKNTAGDHRIELTYGQIKTDTAIYNTASPSIRMTPNSASNKLQSAAPYTFLGARSGLLIPVANGVAGSISAWLRKSAAGDGAAYNGNQPRMIVRRNDALGLTSDTVLATYSASTGSWNQLTATTPVPTDDGCFEVFFDCDGTTGWVNIDDVQISQGVLNDGAKFWFRGSPEMTPNQPIAQQKVFQRGTPY